MSHPFGDLLRQYRARKADLSLARLANLAGYDKAILVRMGQGKKDLTGPSGRERVVRVVGILHDEGALVTLDEANALLATAQMPPLFAGQPNEAGLMRVLQPGELAPPGAPAPPRTTNLPMQLTRFIGREYEIAEVSGLVAAHRLVTLTGAGGVLSAASEYADGVWLVELAPLADAGPLAQAVAAAFGLQTMSRPALTVLKGYLADRHVLLLLDNCEHLIQACAELTEALLRACPWLRVLATSREELNIPGEVTWCVPPLAADEAVQLFAERASAAKPGFAVTPANREWVERICRRLDDMPLALELAAARLRAFSLEQIAARLDDRFHLLTGGSRTALPRQQTLRATIDWSYNLLTEPERALLRTLSVFAGGWTLEAAEAVAAEAIHGAGVLELLEQLVAKSLVVVDADEAAGGVRYRLLETIRHYASDALHLTDIDAGEQKRIRQRHLEYFAELAQRGTLLSEDGSWLWVWDTILAAELDNTRAALSWAAQSGAWQAGWRLIQGLHGVWAVLGYGDEVTEWIKAIVLVNPMASERVRVSAMLTMGSLAHTKGDLAEGFKRYREASAHAHQLADEQLILEADSWLGADTPDDQQAIALLNNVIWRAHQAGRTSVEATGMSLLGDRLRIRGDFQGATALLTDSVRLARESGDRGFLAGQLGVLARLFIDLGDYTQARTVLDESIILNRKENLQGWLEDNLVDLAAVGLYQADDALVREALHEFIPYFHRIDALESVARGFVLAAGLAHARGEFMQAARLLGATAAIRRDHHTHGVYERDLFAEYDRRLPAVRAELDPAAFESAWVEGQHLTLNQAIQEALAV